MSDAKQTPRDRRLAAIARSPVVLYVDMERWSVEREVMVANLIARRIFRRQEGPRA